jgi:hypothetical protein
MEIYFREDMAQISLSVADESGTYRPFGTSDWFSVEGGNLENDDSHTRPGGMGLEQSLGGPSSRGDVTLTRPLDDVVIGWHKTLEERVQQDAPSHVTVKYLNRLRSATFPGAVTFTFAGTLKSAFLPDMDTGSGDAAMYSVVLSADEGLGS